MSKSSKRARRAQLSLAAALLSALLLLVFTTSVVSGGGREPNDGLHTFTVSGEPGQFTYQYVGDFPDDFPQAMYACWELEEPPWYDCSNTSDPPWQGTTLPLTPTVYHVGSGVGGLITYTLSQEMINLGWYVLEEGNGLYYDPPTPPPPPPPSHVFTVRGTHGNFTYEYVGDSPDDFPHFVNMCWHLPEYPWYDCNFNSNPPWDGTSLWLPSEVYFVGTGDAVEYTLSQEMIDLGWYIEAENGLKYEPSFELFLPLVLN